MNLKLIRILKLKSMRFIFKELFISVLILFACYSCDPGYDEFMRIDNESDKTVMLTLNKKNISEQYANNVKISFEHDNPTIKFDYSYSTDSLLLITCELMPKNSFYLYISGGIGTATLKTSKDGEMVLHRTCDSIYISNFELLKDFYDFNNWEIEIKEEKLCDESKFVFIIKDEDLKNNNR